jgi:transcriptional regulator with XRE-family HTH domain
MARTSSPAAAHVGAAIAELRRKRALSVDDLASRTKIDSSNVRAYEAGRAIPGLQSLVRIATALRVTPGRLISGLTPSMFEKDE